MNTPSISIIIPAYNEEESLKYILEDTLQNLSKLVSDFEVIVIDDGSKDNTLRIARTVARKYPRLKVVHRPHGGFGKALLTGIKIAKKDYVAHMQANGQDLVRDMVNCFKIMGQYDLVLGIRGKRIDYDFYRLVLSYGGLLAYRLFFNIRYEDVHWAYIWKREEIQKLNLDPEGGIFILVESLIKFKRKGLKIGEAPAPYRPRFAGVSKITNYTVVLKTLKSMLRLWWKIITGRMES